ncbi:hypothetical protein QL285_080205 [Trifolium repens]|nr:hypothetical protein QL285_080205 [Trifolium repens]
MTSSSLVRTHQNGYPASSSKVSQFDPYLQSFISRRPHVRTQHLRVTTTHATSKNPLWFSFASSPSSSDHSVYGIQRHSSTKFDQGSGFHNSTY